MFDKEAARKIAQGRVDEHLGIDESRVRELQQGWYFPYRCVVVGSNGVIINKRTGKIFSLGSKFSVERDLHFYDRGYQFARYDLVILEVQDASATLNTLLDLGITIIVPEYEHGTVWRIPRIMTRGELADRIEQLPCVLGDVALYFGIEALEHARTAGHFRFEALEYRMRTEAHPS